MFEHFEKKLNRFLIHFVIESTVIPGIPADFVIVIKKRLLDIVAHLMGVYIRFMYWWKKRA